MRCASFVFCYLFWSAVLTQESDNLSREDHKPTPISSITLLETQTVTGRMVCQVKHLPPILVIVEAQLLQLMVPRHLLLGGMDTSLLLLKVSSCLSFRSFVA